MLKFYFDLIKDCKTLNQVNGVHIALSYSMTPLELFEISKLLSETDDHWNRFHLNHPELNKLDVMLNARKWISNIELFTDFGGERPVERFVRRILASTVLHYSAGGPSEAKTLLIGFCGNARSMMIPTPAFLQSVPAGLADVVLLQDPLKEGFRAGLDGVGSSLPTVLKKLPDILDIGAYRRINIMGVSGGGLPAVVAGLNLQADICVVVGANNPDSPRWFVDGRNLARELLACDSTSKLKTEFVYVFGREEEKDQISAKALAEIVPGKMIAIQDPELPVKHNAIAPLAHRKLLTRFLGQVLKFES